MLCALFVYVVIFNTNKPRVMILHSNGIDYSWVRDVNIGLKRVFGKRTSYSILWHYMDTKKHSDKEWQRRAGLIARQTIDKWEPNVLISIDNLAQELAAQYYVNKPGINVIFAGINGPIEPYGYHKGNNTTGILEDRPVKALREVIIALENGKQKKATNNPTRIFYLIDSSESVLADKEYIDKFDWSPLVYTGSFAAKTFEEWQQVVMESAGKTDYIFITNYRQLQRSKIESKFVPAKEVVGWTEKNSPVPVVGLNPFNVEDGAMLSVGTSGYEQGEIAAKMAVDIIDKGKNIKEIPITPNKQFIVSMRKTAILKRGLQLPDIYEAFCRATDTFFE